MKSFRTLAFGLAVVVAASSLMTSVYASPATAKKGSRKSSRQSIAVPPKPGKNELQTVQVTGTGDTLEKAQNDAKMNALTTVIARNLR